MPQRLPAAVRRKVAEAAPMLSDDIAEALYMWVKCAMLPRFEPFRTTEDMFREIGHRWASPPYIRDVLEDALHVQSGRTRRLLAAAVNAIDREVTSRTLPDPRGDRGAPWWHRRLWTG